MHRKQQQAVPMECIHYLNYHSTIIILQKSFRNLMVSWRKPQVTPEKKKSWRYGHLESVYILFGHPVFVKYNLTDAPDKKKKLVNKS